MEKLKTSENIRIEMALSKVIQILREKPQKQNSVNTYRCFKPLSQLKKHEEFEQCFLLLKSVLSHQEGLPIPAHIFSQLNGIYSPQCDDREEFRRLPSAKRKEKFLKG